MYRNAKWNTDDKCVKLRTWDKKGKRITIDCSYEPYLYVESRIGEYTSIFDTKLEKHTFKTPWDRTQFTKRYGSNKFFECLDVNNQFLLDQYWDKVENKDFNKFDLRILFFDIEVDPIPGGEFPKPEEAKAEINVLTCYDTLDKKYHVFSKKDYTGNNLKDRSDVDFEFCKNEKDLLRKFLIFWRSNDYPDIVSAWNLNGFDMPYVCNRMIKQLGEAEYLSLSPYDKVFITSTLNRMKQEVLKYNFEGIVLIDFIDIYAKFKITKQESYKLDFIAQNVEKLDCGKIDYEGLSIYEFMEKDWNRFVEYNIRDVELLVKLEDKLRYFQILRMICNNSCCNYDKGLNTIPVVNGALVIIARKQDKILHTFLNLSGNYEIDEVDKTGGFNYALKGFNKGVVTFDAGSLYPNIVVSCNISPETKIGNASFGNTKDIFNDNNSTMVKFTFVNGKEMNIPTDKFKAFLKKHKLIIACNGTVFSQEKQGLLATFMETGYNDRLKVKSKLKDTYKINLQLKNDLLLLKETNGEPLEIKKLEKTIKNNELKLVQYDIQQYAKKILLNSAYGAFGSRYNSIYDIDIANAITKTGSASIQKVNTIVRTFLKNKIPCITDTQLFNSVVFNDTDSCAISMDTLFDKIFEYKGVDKLGYPINIIKDEGYELIQELDDYINNEFTKWFKLNTNTKKSTLFFNREKICDYGVLLASKNYVLHILDSEGKKEPSFVYKGVELARSTIPKELKDLGKNAVENLIMTQDRISTDKLIKEMYTKYKLMNINSRTIMRRANDMKKYDNGDSKEFVKGTPGHVRAGMNFNRVIKDLKLNHIEEIKSGDILKIVYLEPNKYNMKTIAYVDEYPEEFNNIFKIDDSVTFVKVIYESIKRYYDAVGWPAFNPTSNYELSLYDILAMN